MMLDRRYEINAKHSKVLAILYAPSRVHLQIVYFLSSRLHPTMPKRKAKGTASAGKTKRRRTRDLSTSNVPSANGTASTDTTARPQPSRGRKIVHAQHQCRLLQLPLEIRTRIYQLTLVKEPRTTLLDTDHDDSQDVEPSFLQTCRLARREGLPIFYGQNDWILKGAGSQTSSKWLKNLDAKKIAMIKTVVFMKHRGVYFLASAINAGLSKREGANGAWEVRYIPKRRGKTNYETKFINVDGTQATYLWGKQTSHLMNTWMNFNTISRGSTSWSRKDISFLFDVYPKPLDNAA